MARVEDRRWKTLFQQNDLILARLSQLDALKDAYEKKMQTVQSGFESRLDTLESQVALAISNTTTILLELQKNEMSKKKSKPIPSKMRDQSEDVRSDEFEISSPVQRRASKSRRTSSEKIIPPKATAELVILPPTTVYNQDSSDDNEAETSQQSSVGKRGIRQKKKKNLDLNSFRYFFGISKPDARTNHPGSQAIHPDSPFMAGISPESPPPHNVLFPHRNVAATRLVEV